MANQRGMILPTNAKHDFRSFTAQSPFPFGQVVRLVSSVDGPMGGARQEKARSIAAAGLNTGFGQASGRRP
jgi:hypothetical protein